MPARLQSGQAAPRAGRRGRGERRRYRRATQAPAYRGRQRSYRRVYRREVGQTRNVGRAIGRKVQREQHQRKVKAHRIRVQRKEEREIRAHLRVGRPVSKLSARKRRILLRKPLLQGASGTAHVGTKRRISLRRAGTATGLHEALLRIQTAPLHIGIATAEDPKAVLGSSARSLRDTVVGLPGGLAKAVTDPVGAAKQIGDDYKRRYGPLVEGDVREFKRRVKQESGITPFALDALAASPAAGAALGKTARAGALGSKAQRVATRPRPRLRLSGGPAREQELSPNLFTAGGQRLADRSRERRHARDQRLERRPALQPQPGEVVPFIRGGWKGTAERAQRKDVARRKGRALQAMKSEQAVESRAAQRAVGALSAPERQGFKYAIQFGIRTPAQARQVLARHRDNVVAERETAGTKIPDVLRRTNDELPVIEGLLKNPEAAFTPRLAEVVRQERQREIRVASRDPGLAAGQRLSRRYAAQAETLGLRRQEGESTSRFVRRVRREAEAAGGLERPAYFPSQKRPTIRFSTYAVGGTKAVADDKRYTGALFRSGREDVTPEVFAEGVARKIKRRHNWNLVADSFDRHSFGWGRNKSVGQLLDELDRRGIDASSVALWNPRKYREARAGRERLDDREEVLGEEPAAPGIDAAVDAAAIKGKDALAAGAEFRNTSGWSVVPKEVYDEIHAETRPSGPVARSFDIAKGKQARVMLGLGNLPWLQFQVMSNAILTGFARTGPVDVAKAQVWWKRLSPEEKRAVEPFVGIGHFQTDVQQTKLGAAANNRVVNAYRAMKQTTAGKAIWGTRGRVRVADLNPLDLLFRVDNAQNNFFRRAVLYNQVKRDAYQRLGRATRQAGALEDRLVGMLTLGPEQQMRAVIRDFDAIERHGNVVSEMLGDYTTYTAKERRTLGRAVMFYGFLRFSLHFTFLTMPSKHPVITGILGNLSRLHADEVRELLGGDELPFALGRIYYTKDGTLRSVDLSRGNPAANVLTQIRAPKDALNLLPPVFVSALDQLYSKSSFRDRPWRVAGETQGRLKGEDYGAGDRARIFLGQMLRLAAPYRTAQNVTQFGPHGDDTLLGSARPTRYKDPEIVASIREDVARQRARGTGRLLLEELIPFLPSETRDPEIAKSIRERRKGKKKAKGLFGGSKDRGEPLFGGGKQGGAKLFD